MNCWAWRGLHCCQFLGLLVHHLVGHSMSLTAVVGTTGLPPLPPLLVHALGVPNRQGRLGGQPACFDCARAQRGDSGAALLPACLLRAAPDVCLHPRNAP